MDVEKVAIHKSTDLGRLACRSKSSGGCPASVLGMEHNSDPNKGNGVRSPRKQSPQEAAEAFPHPSLRLGAQGLLPALHSASAAVRRRPRNLGVGSFAPPRWAHPHQASAVYEACRGTRGTRGSRETGHSTCAPSEDRIRAVHPGTLRATRCIRVGARSGTPRSSGLMKGTFWA